MAENNIPGSRAERETQAFKTLMRAGIGLVIGVVVVIALMYLLFPPKNYTL
jgi:hypothetical protein